jgi:hypothetical protein
MKTISIIAIILSLCCHSYGQGLECGNRLVYCFDLDVVGFNPFTDIKYQHIYTDDLEKQASSDKTVWCNLHRATPGYKSQLQISDGGSSGRVFFNVGNINNVNPWMLKLCYGSPSQNYSALAGDAILSASYVLQPPNAGSVDYIIYGAVTNSQTQEHTIEIKCINFRENEILCTRNINFSSSKISNDYSITGDPYSIASTLMEGFAPKFESSILPDYEKNKRNKSNEEDNGEVAIEPKFEFDQASYEVEYESVWDRSEEITITLIDCDGEPLKNKEITVEAKKGSILEDKVITDDDGEAEVTYLSPEKSCTDKITASWDFKYPCGKKNKVVKSVPVKVKAPISNLDAQITINTTNTSYSPSKQNQRQSSTQNYVITGKLKCSIMRERIIMYNDNPSKRSECDAGTHCPVLDGSSNNVERDPNDVTKNIKDERFPLYVGVDYMEMSYRYVDGKEKYVKTLTSKAEGANPYEAIDLEIKPYSAPFGVPASLSPQYVIWLNGGVYLDKLMEHPVGNGSGMHWDDFKQALVPSEGPFAIGIPYNISDADINLNENQIYDQLIITDVKGFDNYLLNPQGAYSVSASATRYSKDESFESEGTINVIITFNPQPEEKDPDWDNW